MRTFLMNNWLSIVILAAFFIYTGILAYQKKWEQLRGIAYRLMLTAERAILGSKMGQQRFEQVFSQLYSLIPLWIRFLFPEELARKTLQSWYLELKDFLDNGKRDGIAL